MTRHQPYEDKILLQVKICNFYIKVRRNFNKNNNVKMRAENGNTSQNQVSFYHQNIPGKTKSPKDQICEIEAVITKLCPDILIISEANTELVCNWVYPGYTAYKGHLKGADLVRISAIVKTSLQPVVTHLDCEVPNVVVSFKIYNKQYRVTGCYREWNYGGVKSDAKDQEARWTDFEDAWYLNNRRCKRSCLLGDLNFDFLGKATTHQQSLEPIRNSVIDNICLRGWKQFITGNTRHQGDQQPACLDHVYYNDVSQVKFHVNKPYTSDDHNTVGIVVRTKRFIPPGASFKSRCWSKTNWNWARYLVRYSSNFHEIFSYKDPDSILDCLEGKLWDVMETVAPEQNVTIKPGTAKWMTSYLEDRLNHRDKLKEAWIKSGLRSDERRWREDKKEVRFLIRRAKQEQVERDLETKDLHKRWERINRITGAPESSGPPTELLEDGEVVKEPLELAEILNTGFRAKVNGIMERTVADPEAALNMFEDYVTNLEEKNRRKMGKFTFKEIDVRDAKEAIMSLQNTPSLGTDGIPTVLLKELAWVLAPYVCYLINVIFRTGVFPAKWREGIVTPIWKRKGPKNLKGNYRPVTITNSLSKVWEKVANKQLQQYLFEYNIMDDSQHAYRKGKGVDSFWQDLTSRICHAKDRGKKVLIMGFDLSSAFNLCQRSILIPKLRRLGFQESALTLLTEVLRDRKVATKIEGCLSSWATVDVGVFEGGIISPVMFNLSVVDFAAIKFRVEKEAKEGFTVPVADPDTGEIEDKVVTAPSLLADPGVYADDSHYHLATDTEAELRHAAVLVDRHVVNFFTVNGHAVNLEKSEILSILNRFSEPVVVGEVSSQQELKLLGLKMSEKMSFVSQAKDVISKVSSKLPGILRMKEWASPELLKKTSESVLLSHFTYLLQCYGGEQRVQILLQRCLNKVMRGILGREIRSSVTQMLTDLDWLSIPNLVRYKTLFWFRETDRAAQAPYTWSLLEPSTGHGYHTRRLRLEPKFPPQTMVSSLSFIHRGASLYSEFNLFPDLSEGDDYKDLVRSKILAKYPNTNM